MNELIIILRILKRGVFFSNWLSQKKVTKGVTVWMLGEFIFFANNYKFCLFRVWNLRMLAKTYHIWDSVFWCKWDKTVSCGINSQIQKESYAKGMYGWLQMLRKNLWYPCNQKISSIENPWIQSSHQHCSKMSYMVPNWDCHWHTIVKFLNYWK